MKAASLLALALLTSAASVPAFALAYSYRIYCSGNAGGASIQSWPFWPNALRGLGSYDVATAPNYPSQTHLAIYKRRGMDDWSTDVTFLSQDARLSLQAGQADVVNDIYYRTGVMSTTEILKFGINASVPHGTIYALRLKQIPNGVSYIGPTEWGPNYSGTINLPVYMTDNPLTGYKFQVEIAAPLVPEPSTNAVSARMKNRFLPLIPKPVVMTAR